MLESARRQAAPARSRHIFLLLRRDMARRGMKAMAIINAEACINGRQNNDILASSNNVLILAVWHSWQYL